MPTIVALLASSLATALACAWQGPAVRATLQGRTLRYSRVSGEYCGHCAGKQTVFVQAEGEDVITLSLAFDFNDCKVLRKVRIGADGHAALVYGEPDDANDRGHRAVTGGNRLSRGRAGAGRYLLLGHAAERQAYRGIAEHRAEVRFGIGLSGSRASVPSGRDTWTALDTQPMKLLQPLVMGSLTLPNRVVMAPMTRSRADDAGRVGPLHVTYYRQRATAGLIVSEGINISSQAIGSPFTPGIYNEAQVAAWRPVTGAVHEAGGRIFAQLWHTGRVGHSLVRGGELPVAPSPVRIEGQQHFTPSGPRDYETPRELSTTEVLGVIADYRTAAANAKIGCFDGVELHAFGYLPNQFRRRIQQANRRIRRFHCPTLPNS